MKKFIDYLKSPKSDFLLFVIALILANLVAQRAFVRLDLTGPQSYSLSQASIQTVKTLEEPLSVKVFFSENLPAPYNQVEQYIRDILVEYKGKANKNFSYEFFNMNDQANERIAANYGLNKIQIQQLKNNEVGFKQVWMGMVFSYADAIETLDGLQSSDGLEYKITTTINKMVATSSTLAGLKGKVTLNLYASNDLSKFNIQGFKELNKVVSDAYKAVNKKNQDKIQFASFSPAAEEVSNLVSKYGIQGLNWKNADGTEGQGALGLVIEYEDNFRLLPLKMTRTLFGGNVIMGLDTLTESLEESLKSLVSKTQEIGYITGHGIKALDDENSGAMRLNALVADRYTFKEIDLREADIPTSITSIVINGPFGNFDDRELYKIDQFLLKGGNLIIFADPFLVKEPEGQNAYYQQPTFSPINSGLEKILEKNGIKLGHNYVLDKNCFQQQNQYTGLMPIYYAPMLHRSLLDSKSPITKNLGYVIFLQNGSIDVSAAQENKDEKVTVLARSSAESWLLEKNISLNPAFMGVPSDKSLLSSQNLAVLVEGKFTSAFEENPDKEESGNDEVLISEHLNQSVQKGKIFVTGTSLVTTSQLIDESGSQPIALFVRNVIDYMNGEEDLCTMRTKGLSLNALKVRTGSSAVIAKYFNQYGLVLLVIIAGLLMWRKRSIHRKNIRMTYDPDDSREVGKDGKTGSAEAK